MRMWRLKGYQLPNVTNLEVAGQGCKLGVVALASVLSVTLPHACLWIGLEQERGLTRAFRHHLSHLAV